MPRYFLFRKKNGALVAFVGYSVEFALKAIGITIDDIKAWDSRPTSLPCGKSPLYYLLEGV